MSSNAALVVRRLTFRQLVPVLVASCPFFVRALCGRQLRGQGTGHPCQYKDQRDDPYAAFHTFPIQMHNFD
jgi:hypothetical protein